MFSRRCIHQPAAINLADRNTHIFTDTLCMTDMSHQVHCGIMLRSAVAINNMAVSLLEKRCYKSAMDTFKECLELLKETASEKGRSSCVDVPKKMHAALSRLARLVPSCSRAQVPVVLDIMSTSTLLNSLSQTLEESPEPHSNVVSCIRIDQLDTGENLEEGPAFVAAVVLYNFAIACYCMSKVAKSASAHEKLLRATLKLLLASHAAIVSHVPFEVESYATAIPLETIVLRALVSQSMPPIDLVHRYEDLLRMQKEIDNLSGSLFSRSHSAPAA